MIFVTIGTTASFDRLLAAVADLGQDEELVVQCGDSSRRLAHATCVTYLDYDELVAYVRRARVVVSHAGVGTIMTVLANGKVPFVLPRRREHREAVDDHQVELATRLDALKLVRLVRDEQELEVAVRSAHQVPDDEREVRSGALVDEIRSFIDATVAVGVSSSDARGAASPVGERTRSFWPSDHCSSPCLRHTVESGKCRPR